MKRILAAALFLLGACAIFSAASCGKATPSPDASTLARQILTAAGLSEDDFYEEALSSAEIERLGMTASVFEKQVSEASVLRPLVDTTGCALILLRARDGASWDRLAETMRECYEWAPCDLAETLVIAHDGAYLLAVKSSTEETARLVAGFRSLGFSPRVRTRSLGT